MTEPRAVVERLVETLNDHDLAAGRALYAPGARLVAATGRVMDLDGLDTLLGASLQAFPDLRIRIERWAVDGDTVMTEEVMEGTHNGPFAGLPPTGRRVHLPMVHVTRVTSGHIVERIAYHDTAGILRQLGDP
ncbi:MAG TPA: ester cyclase [Acidimicrobiales bacterium]|nr:ester cyclase [Acidimicrobiales bacterium]